MTEPTGKDKEIQEKLDAILGGELKSYVVVDRTARERDSRVGTYRLYGNVGTEEAVILHLINFIDGFLVDDEFALFASIVSKRTMERLGVDIGPLLGQGEEAQKPN